MQLARLAAPQIVAPECRPVEARVSARVIEDAAASVTPVAGDGRDAADGPHRHPAAAVALQPDPDADAGRPGVRQAPAQRDDGFGGHSADRRRALRWILEDPFAE